MNKESEENKSIIDLFANIEILEKNIYEKLKEVEGEK